MYRNRKLVRAIKKFFRQFRRKSSSTVKKQSLWLLRTFIVTKKRKNWANSGFVLPTVAMVSLVVVLLTIAIMFRSFERSKNASNVRVNQVVLNAAMPAIDRAKAKIDKLFDDPSLPRSTPSDNALYTAITKDKKLAGYTFGDETPLAVRYDINANSAIDTASNELENKEVTNSAWRFPVDTDNNGKYDSFTLYSLNFRSPSRAVSTGKFDRARTPLDARTPPMDDGSLGGLCSAAAGTSSSIIGDSGWYKSGGNLKKSFFVYVTTVPITENDANTKYGNKYEKYQGNKGFSSVEFQVDQERIPIVNNAVVYEDDLEITPGAGLNINGRIFTNSNLFTARIFDPIRLYQVSSPKSCFYQAEFSKIIVGGNLGLGRIFGSNTRNSVQVDLFKRGAAGSQATVDNNTRSISNSSADTAYNALAYAVRINLQVEQALSVTGTLDNYSQDPQEVQEKIRAKLADSNNTKQVEDIRREELEAYFKKRTRKVPFADPIQQPTSVTLQGTGTDKLRGPDSWIYPFALNNNNTSYTGLTLFLDRLPATEPNKLKEVYKEDEKFLGDRILVGNNLPALWYDPTNGFVGRKTSQEVLPKSNSTEWTDYLDEENKYRYRNTRIEQLVSLEGATKRNDFFEQQAVETPKNPLDNVGGMRVVTGAGIYIDGSTNYPRNSIATSPSPRAALTAPYWDTNFVDTTNTDPNRVWVNSLNFNNNTAKPPIITWSDSMSMGDPNVPNSRGDLLMRATAVYHYKDNSGKDQKPMACVSSYYDPTNANTAQNNSAAWKNPNATPAINGKSNNGIVYPSYSAARTSAISTYRTQLENQARLVFPNGRFANEPLRNAMQQVIANQPLSMADNSAIDTAVCAIEILNGTLTPNSTKIPHGTIYETSFLDSRQIQSIENTPTDPAVTQDYRRSLEQRQPLEVRVTVLDIDKLRLKRIGSGSPEEFLLPNSGIIYATRDDALPDLSAQPGLNQNNVQAQKKNTDRRNLISPTDYKLDPTRRPNGIMLINGSRLDRKSTYRDEEKGIILASNVPAYVKGDFNLHAKGGDKSNQVEEFTDRLINPTTKEIDWSKFYTRAGLDDNFACRTGDPRLPGDKCRLGDSWRPATILADAVTILSDNFRFGFRSEGDYDLRNNADNAVVPNYDFNNNGVATDILDETVLRVDLNGNGNITDTSVSEVDQISTSAVRRKLGFFENNFLTSADWVEPSGAIDSPKDFDTSSPPPGLPTIQGSSYVNNFVTPIQRRVNFNEYLMEVCPKIPVHTCTPADWSVDGAGIKATDQIGQTYQIATHRAGTTVDLAYDSNPTDQNPELRQFARRVAFARDTTVTVPTSPTYGNLILDDSGQPVPLGIDGSGNIRAFPRNTVATRSAWTVALPRTSPKALWFRTTEKTDGLPGSADVNYGNGKHLFYQTVDGRALTGTDPNEQPLLVPVLQIHMPNDNWTSGTGNPGTDRDSLPDAANRGIAKNRNWLQRATKTTTNLAIVGGDTPASRTETNGGLENFVRYSEQWFDGTNDVKHSLSGSLIQYKRSAYATAPWQTLKGGGSSLFGGYQQLYRTDITGGQTPFYTPPSRQWGFDVGLLSQLPDLFAQTFTLPPTRKPNEFFREVNQDDKWVQSLLCAKTANVSTNGIQITANNAVPDNQRPTEFCTQKTGG